MFRLSRPTSDSFQQRAYQFNVKRLNSVISLEKFNLNTLVKFNEDSRATDLTDRTFTDETMGFIVLDKI